MLAAVAILMPIYQKDSKRSISKIAKWMMEQGFTLPQGGNMGIST